MTVAPDSFRISRPEFSSVTDYPDATIAAQIASAELRVKSDVWGDLRDQGIELLVAHNLALSTRARKNVATGSAGGLVASKSVDKVSISYDTSMHTYQGAGAFNLTLYGVEFWQLANMMGAGGWQL